MGRPGPELGCCANKNSRHSPENTMKNHRNLRSKTRVCCFPPTVNSPVRPSSRKNSLINTHWFLCHSSVLPETRKQEHDKQSGPFAQCGPSTTCLCTCANFSKFCHTNRLKYVKCVQIFQTSTIRITYTSLLKTHKYLVTAYKM